MRVVPDDSEGERYWSIEMDDDEHRVAAIANVMRAATWVIDAERELTQARLDLAKTVAFQEGPNARIPLPKGLLKHLLGPAYPAEVEQVRDGSEVAQEGVVAPEPEPALLGAQEACGAVEEGHPAPHIDRVLGEAHSGAVSGQENR